MYDIKNTFLFIARNEEEDKELWLTSCTCGYGGTGPTATKEVLEILGVKTNYSRIFVDKKIVEAEVKPRHDFNLVIYNPVHDNPYRAGKRRLNVRISFDFPHQKWDFKKALAALGIISPLKNIEEVKNHFTNDYVTVNESSNYCTNNGLILDNDWTNCNIEVLLHFIVGMIKNYNGTKNSEKSNDTFWFLI